MYLATVLQYANDIIMRIGLIELVRMMVSYNDFNISIRNICQSLHYIGHKDTI